MAFEPWIGSATPTPYYTPYYVNTGLANETNTAGYWFVKTDEVDGGKSKVVWPVNVKTEADSLAPVIDFCKGVCGTADLDKGNLTYKPFVSVGFNVVGEGAEGKPAPGNASSWGGICITFRSDVAPSLELSLGDYDATIEYALPAISFAKSINGEEYINGESYRTCIPWSDFKQPAWYREATKISGTEAAAQLVSINFKMQGAKGQYKFNICAIGPYGEKIEGEELPTGAKSLPTTCPKVLTMHPEISVSAKWSKGNDGYDATITVKDGEKELTEGTDYEIESNVNDATGIVIKTITGKGDYAGSVVKSLVPYIDENGEPQVMYDATVLTNNKDGVTELSGGWYVATGKVNMAGIKFNGEAHLILADDAEMVIETGDEYGIYASNNLTIYGQTEQNGILKATGNSEGIDSDGNITISGGTVIATGTNGDGIYSSDGNITISGGTVTATGEYFCIYGYNGVSISGGTVTATGEDLVILGYKGVTISGGSVTATGTNGDGIYSYSGDITLDWTNSTDFIKASSYSLGDNEKHVSIAEGKSFKDENDKEYSGTIDDVSDIAGKTLVPPSFNGKFLSNVNVAVADIPVQKYVSGKPVCPSVVVTDGKDTLTAGTDYAVTCVNNTAVTSANLDEAAIAQITGKGNYAGAIQKRFFIWENIGNYAAVQVYKDKKGDSHAEIDGAYDGTDAVAIDEDVENVAVKFNRKFPKGKYSTIVLPFDVNTENVEGFDAVLRYNGIKTVNGESSVRMKVVWATSDWVEKNQIKNEHGEPAQYYAADLTANTPYLVQMGQENLKVNGGVTLKKTAPADVSIDGWTFRGTWQYKKWGPSCSTEGQNCDRETGNAYGFAASSSDDDKINVGDFVRVGEGAWILPMRAYLVSTDILESTPPAQGVRANGNYVKRPSFAQEDLPEFMSIVIDVDDEGKETTVIGQFNTRTGEIKMNYDPGKFDLKGRRVNSEKQNARGAYYGKKVLKKY